MGQENYLKFLSRGFHTAYALGFLKNNRNYQFNYFVKRIVKKGDYVVDLGANLGYFSRIFSNIVGGGALYALSR